jgi:CcmD family protein
MSTTTQTQPSPDDRGTTFRPTEGGGDSTSGTMLLVEAYGAIWLLAFALIVFSLRKQRRLDQRIERLQVDLDRARRDEKPAAEKPAAERPAAERPAAKAPDHVYAPPATAEKAKSGGE